MGDLTPHPDLFEQQTSVPQYSREVRLCEEISQGLQEQQEFSPPPGTKLTPLWSNGQWNAIRWTPEMLAHLRKRRDERASIKRISEELRVSDRTVRQKIADLGMPVHLPALQPETHEEARIMHRERPERTDPWVQFKAPTWRAPIPPARTCQYPHGDEAPFTFCGKPTWRKSYCKAHFLACYQVEV